MAEGSLQDVPVRLPVSVRSWRYDCLKDAGYPQEEAYLLAKRLDVDLHRACEMLAQGCPVDVAVHILS